MGSKVSLSIFSGALNYITSEFGVTQAVIVGSVTLCCIQTERFRACSICRTHFDWCSVHKNVLVDMFEEFAMLLLEEKAPLHLHVAAHIGLSWL